MAPLKRNIFQERQLGVGTLFTFTHEGGNTANFAIFQHRYFYVWTHSFLNVQVKTPIQTLSINIVIKRANRIGILVSRFTKKRDSMVISRSFKLSHRESIGLLGFVFCITHCVRGDKCTSH